MIRGGRCPLHGVQAVICYMLGWKYPLLVVVYALMFVDKAGWGTVRMYTAGSLVAARTGIYTGNDNRRGRQKCLGINVYDLTVFF